MRAGGESGEERGRSAQSRGRSRRERREGEKKDKKGLFLDPRDPAKLQAKFAQFSGQYPVN